MLMAQGLRGDKLLGMGQMAAVAKHRLFKLNIASKIWMCCCLL